MDISKRKGNNDIPYSILNVQDVQDVQRLTLNWLVMGGQSWDYYIGSPSGIPKDCSTGQVFTVFFPEGGVV